jgi:hypothetical protein
MQPPTHAGWLKQVHYMFSLDQETGRHGPENPSASGHMGWSAYDAKQGLLWMIPDPHPLGLHGLAEQNVSV